MRKHSLGFTLIEMMLVISIIIILAGLVLMTSSYVQKKGARSRTEAEIAALSAALENYKADNGVYPSDATTEALDPKMETNPANYEQANLSLYKSISGDADNDSNRTVETKSYFSFKPNQLNPNNQAQPVKFISDPFGNAFGYSTAHADATKGYNPTFDLWSTSGSNDPAQWIKNW